MHIEDHYWQLRTHLHGADGTAVPVTMDELMGLFGCTRQNVKLILRKMIGRQWIEWTPGLGRRNKSKLVFKRPLDEHAASMIRDLLAKGEPEQAYELIRFSFKRKDASGFGLDMLDSFFGFAGETSERRPVHVLRLPFYRAMGSLDPAEVRLRTESHMVRHIFDTLVRFDEEKSGVIPHLALEWERNSSGTSWVFYIRRGVLFHDGREMTSSDVTYSLRRLCRKNASVWGSMIRSVETAGVHAVRIELREENGLLPNLLASPEASIIPDGSAEGPAEGEFAVHPLGTGPFRVMENGEERLVLEAFPSYFRGRVQLDRVELWVFPELSRSRETEAQGFSSMHYYPVKAETSGLAKFHTFTAIERGCTYLSFQLNKQGVHRHASFRKALRLLLDRSDLVKVLGHDRFLPADGFLPKPVASSPISEEGLECVESLLAEAGYRGEPVSLWTYPVLRGDFERTAEWIETQCRQAGIRLDIRILPYERLRESAGQADILLLGILAGEDMELFLHNMILGDSGLWMERLPAELRESLQDNMRNRCKGARKKDSEALRFLEEVESQLKEENHMLFLYHNVLSTVIDERLRGVRLTSYGWLRFDEVWEKPCLLTFT